MGYQAGGGARGQQHPAEGEEHRVDGPGHQPDPDRGRQPAEHQQHSGRKLVAQSGNAQRGHHGHRAQQCGFSGYWFQQVEALGDICSPEQQHRQR